MNSETLPLAIGETRKGLGLPGKYWRTYTDFSALEHALLSGDLSAARDAFDRLKEDSPTIAAALSRDPFPNDNCRLRAFKELGRCLLARDLHGAKLAAQQFQFGAVG